MTRSRVVFTLFFFVVIVLIVLLALASGVSVWTVIIGVGAAIAAFAAGVAAGKANS